MWSIKFTEGKKNTVKSNLELSENVSTEHGETSRLLADYIGLDNP